MAESTETETGSTETTARVWCSFCGKANTLVQKMIGGPGVHICDECVNLCNTILAEETDSSAQPKVAIWESLDDEQILTHIPRIAAVEAQIDHNLREWVGELRNRGITWERIGTALGVTRQSAWERFSGER